MTDEQIAEKWFPKDVAVTGKTPNQLACLDALREKELADMERACRAMCKLCADGVPLSYIVADKAYRHQVNYTTRRDCTASPIRADFQREG